jgi:hypothetical protein
VRGEEHECGEATVHLDDPGSLVTKLDEPVVPLLRLDLGHRAGLADDAVAALDLAVPAVGAPDLPVALLDRAQDEAVTGQDGPGMSGQAR